MWGKKKIYFIIIFHNKNTWKRHDKVENIALWNNSKNIFTVYLINYKFFSLNKDIKKIYIKKFANI